MEEKNINFKSLHEESTEAERKERTELIFGKDNKSVDLTKKFPWKVCKANPRVHRILITASNPIFLVKYLLKALSNFAAIGVLWTTWYPGKCWTCPPENFEIPLRVAKSTYELPKVQRSTATCCPEQSKNEKAKIILKLWK